jgi:hypothetical protein
MEGQIAVKGWLRPYRRRCLPSDVPDQALTEVLAVATDSRLWPRAELSRACDFRSHRSLCENVSTRNVGRMLFPGSSPD